MEQSLLNALTAIHGLTTTLAAVVTSVGAILATLYAAFQRWKLTIDEVFKRETHNLQLFSALAHDNPQYQLAAAAVLVERLRRLQGKRQRSTVEESERAAIIRALISVTKDCRDRRIPEPAMDSRRRVVAIELGKFVADSVAKILDAVDESVDGLAKTTKSRRMYPKGPSPLRKYDWQWANLRYAWWPSIDAREVDFFAANLADCGMKFGDFRKAQLRGADLSNSNLLEANLERASFQGAVLKSVNLTSANVDNANFNEADLTGAKMLGIKNLATASFMRAKYDSKTTFPDDPAWAAHQATMIRAHAPSTVPVGSA